MNADSIQTTRRTFMFGLAAIPLLSLDISCARTKEDRKVIVGFIDVSASVTNYAPFHSAWKKISSSLREGDRIMLAPISDLTLTQFKPFIDLEIPTFSWWSGVKAAHDDEMKKIEESLSEVFDRAEKAPRAQRTDITNAFVLAGKVFSGDPRKPVLCIFSDGLEDSSTADFEHDRLTESETKRIIKSKQLRHAFPELHGANVYFIGASASTADKASEVEQFWLEFVRVGGGNLAPEHYGPALLHFDE